MNLPYRIAFDGSLEFPMLLGTQDEIMPRVLWALINEEVNRFFFYVWDETIPDSYKKLVLKEETFNTRDVGQIRIVRTVDLHTMQIETFTAHAASFCALQTVGGYPPAGNKGEIFSLWMQDNEDEEE